MKTIHRLFRKMSDWLELGYYIEATRPLLQKELDILQWFIAETFEPNLTKTTSFFGSENIVEIGPRLTIETPFSSNALSACRSVELHEATRIEYTRRYRLQEGQMTTDVLKKHLDRMIEQQFSGGILTYETGIKPEPVKIVDILGRGMCALKEINKERGLGMDAADMEYYYDLFYNKLKRNPNNVEIFQLGNANSDHSRHGHFKSIQVIDGVTMPHSLMELVQAPLNTLKVSNKSSRVAFYDNAGVNQGHKTWTILPENPGMPSRMILVEKTIHNSATAETHNHPTFVFPFSGGQTGAGGRERDNTAVGRGGITGIGISGYMVGNLFIPGYSIPGEIVGKDNPSKYASPLTILTEGIRGIATYGNEYGEACTLGFCRSFEQIVDGQWYGSRKPILYTAGIGHIFDEHLKKETPRKGMRIVAIGGPAYPIGVGGGSASSMMQGQNTEALDFSSVQRGNPEMKNKVNRVIRACVEMGGKNPISSIHDQGAGGPSNVLTELMEPLGGTIDISKIILGDKTMSILEIWSAEYQERYGLLIEEDKLELFKSICTHERVNCEVLGEITGDKKVVVTDSETTKTYVDLNLEQVLTNIPQKTFVSKRIPRTLTPLEVPEITVEDALKAVFKQLSVGSKAFITNQKDRSVTGLIAQQQCCGLAQIPIADSTVIANSHFGVTGCVGALGEQPIKALVDPKAGARMALGEMLTNMASTLITNINDIRCRVNCMAPAKLDGEGPPLYDGYEALSETMIKLGIAADGGKDSLSMAAKVLVDGFEQTVKTPGTIVIFGYAPVADITKKVTPDIKRPGKSLLAMIDLGLGKNRMGGSAFAQAHNQIGDKSPDMDNPQQFLNSLLVVQQLIEKGLILSLHDRSDGGLITSVSEMCMASGCGFDLKMNAANHTKLLEALLAEELGFFLEFNPEDEKVIRDVCMLYEIPFARIGATKELSTCRIENNGSEVLNISVGLLRSEWEKTSFEIEKLQMDYTCATEEFRSHRYLLPRVDNPISYHLTFEPRDTSQEVMLALNKPKVAILREEGTNGDREMNAVCQAAGLEPWDVSMNHLLEGSADLEQFQGIVFAGGFSYMDVFGSAKGWAGTILFNEKLKEMFNQFYTREDTFSLGVCNGCQLMALLGWIPWKGIERKYQPRFVHNKSSRFESRWAQVAILPSPSILLDGMAGSRLGIWVAHGEGRLVYPNSKIEQEVSERKLAPLAYIDPQGSQTEAYPYNPNGSPKGITALCSPDGRHLAMMPHPERCFRLWQWPWMPSSWKNVEASPWLKMFQNARDWCVKHSS